MALTRIAGYGHVAMKYGLEEAIFLETIMFWWRANRANDRNFKDGRWWTYNTIQALAEIFPWWSVKQVRRIANSCREQDALLIGSYNEDGRDRTIWYSPSDSLLVLYGEKEPTPEPEEQPPEEPNEPEQPESNCPNGQMHLPERADSFAQMGTALPCNNHVVTNIPPYNPPEGDAAGSDPEDPPRAPTEVKRKLTQEELFDAFWTVYPRKDKKQDARKAWKKLKPDLPLCRKMSAALKKEKQTEKWTKEGGRYIPLASTWLNGREWENQGIDHTQICVQQEAPQGGWVPDPEVTE